jgi:hypothetical protein
LSSLIARETKVLPLITSKCTPCIGGIRPNNLLSPITKNSWII